MRENLRIDIFFVPISSCPKGEMVISSFCPCGEQKWFTGLASPRRFFQRGERDPAERVPYWFFSFLNLFHVSENSFWQYFLDPDRRRCISCRSKVKNCFSWSSNQFLTKICYALSASNPGAPRLRCWFIFTSPSLHIGCSHDQRASLSSLFSCPVYLYRTAWFLHRTHPSR